MAPVADQTQMRLPRVARLGLLAAILVAGALLRCQAFEEPFGEGFRGVNGALYYGQFERHFQEHGLSGTRFGLILQSWPGTDQGMLRYLTHPPLAAWLFHGAVTLWPGPTEAGLRLVPLLVSVLGIAALYLAAARIATPPAGLLAAALAATSPMWAFFGVMTVPQAFLLLLEALFLLVLVRRLTGTGGLAPVLLVFALGCLLDWDAYFLAPAAWIAAPLLVGGRRWPRELLWLLPVGVGCFGLFLGWATWSSGSWAAVQEALLGAGGTAGLTPGAGAWLAAQGRFIVSGYGWPLLALFAGWTLTLLPGRRRLMPGADAGVVLFLVTGVLGVLAFPRHAFDHPFWTMGLAGGLYLAAGVLVARLLRRRARLLVCACLALAGWSALWGTLETRSLVALETTDRFRERAQVINGIAGPDDLVVTSEPWMQEHFYVNAHAYSHIRTLAWFQQAILEPYQALGLRARIVLVIPKLDLDRDPEVQELARWVMSLGVPRREVGRYQVWIRNPPG